MKGKSKIKSNSLGDEMAKEKKKNMKMKAKPKEQQITSKLAHVSTGKKHRQSLDKLKKQDPEFYEFLKREDKELLDFQESDSDNDVEKSDSDQSRESDDGSDSVSDSDQEVSDADSDSSESGSDEDAIHKPPSKLEVASDEEEDESDEGDSDTGPPTKKKKKKPSQEQTPVTMKMVNSWTKSLETNENTLATIHSVIMAFQAAVRQVSGEDTDDLKYTVHGSTVFNAIVRLCIRWLLPTLNRILGVKKSKDIQSTSRPSASNRWKKLKVDVKYYLSDLIKMVSGMGEAAVLSVLMKHVYQAVPYFACFARLSKYLVKKLLKHWSTGEETIRVLAFLSINRLTRLNQDFLLEFCIKNMYMAYVANCKFTSPNTLPMINFMQRSLVEVLAIDVTLTYQYAFIYIRQLAIHLRNAITVKKQETCQAVYNWQYVHSLHLWVRLLSQLHPDEILHPLIYPLTQVIIGTIKLIPTAQYYPLRFHCIKMLNMLCESTNTYIPVLSFLMEVLEITDFNKKPKTSKMTPLNFACALKLSKGQVNEKSFKDGVIEQLYEHMLDHLHIYAHTISFPELILPAIIQMKKFAKTCKVSNYSKQIRQVIEKVEETSKLITQRRKTASLTLSDSKAVDAWEVRSKEEGTPLGKYYATWRKLRDRELLKQASGTSKVSTDDLPTINRNLKRATDDDRQEFADLFNSDDDDDDDNELRFLPKEERAQAKKQKTEDSDSEEYSDFNEEELEILARSGSEDSEEDDDDDDGSKDETENQHVKQQAISKTFDEDSDEDGEDIVEDLELSDDDDDEDDVDNNVHDDEEDSDEEESE